MKWNWSVFKRKIRRASSLGEGDQLDRNLVKEMLREIVITRPDEIGCDECFQQVDRFVELVLDGKNAAEALPLVQDHLERCRDCREEYEALLAALKAVA